MITFVLIFFLAYGAMSRAGGPTVTLSLDGNVIEGTPAAWSGHQVLLLARNGFLWRFAPERAVNYRKTSDYFRPFSQREMRSQLSREFGSKFDVSGTGNYLVVHPAGQRDLWAHRFESLYRSFVGYFAARGLKITASDCPLVAVVFHSRKAFVQYVEREGGRATPGMLGFYSLHTNRIILYDVTQGDPDHLNWHLNAETILHEATHQVAFNTCVHNRLAQPPRWVAEGLAMLFEAPGVWDVHRYPRLKDRVNWARLASFQEILKANRPKAHLVQFVSQTAEEFASDPRASYAEAWALSFFLSEKEPTRYADYLSITASRQPLRKYTKSEQLREFTNVFGKNLLMLDARFLRFISSLAQDRRSKRRA